MVMDGGISSDRISLFSFCKLYLAAMAVIVVCGSVTGAPEDIGNFDIEKVRSAAQYADTGLGDAPLPAGERENIIMVVLRITLYLGLLVAVILGVSWFLKRKGLQAVRGDGAMDVIETLPVGQNRMLLLIRVLDEIYLVGQTSSSITLLDKLSGQKAMDVIASSRGGGTIMNFKDAFNSFMGKMKKPV